jgi:hypothetical protein
MHQERIKAALQMAGDTRHLLIEGGALGAAPALLAQAFGGQPALVIADENTLAAAGREVA